MVPKKYFEKYATSICTAWSLQARDLIWSIKVSNLSLNVNINMPNITFWYKYKNDLAEKNTNGRFLLSTSLNQYITSRGICSKIPPLGQTKQDDNIKGSYPYGALTSRHYAYKFFIDTMSFIPFTKLTRSPFNNEGTEDRDIKLDREQRREQEFFQTLCF